MKYLRVVLGFGAVLALSPSAVADTIATDRPGNGNAASTVPRHRLQLETSVSYLRHDAGVTVQQFTLPTLLRFGVTPKLEARLGSSLIGYDATDGSDEGASLTDTSIGAKLALTDNRGWTPQLGAMVDVFLPTGNGSFTNDTTVPDARVAAAWSLPKSFGLLINGGFDLPEGADGRVFRLGYVVNLGYAPPSLAGLSVFVELFGRIDFDTEDIAQFDAGAAYILGPNLQIDFFLQYGLTNAAPDLQLAAGLSLRH